MKLPALIIAIPYPGDGPIILIESTNGVKGSFGMMANDDVQTIVLGERTAQSAAEYFNATNNELFRAFIPQKATSVEEAIADYELSRLPTATSFGKTVLLDGRHIGDIWCYCIDYDETPNAMLSYCIFAREEWNKKIASKALDLFLVELKSRFDFKTIGAFTYSDNASSIRVLEKNGFKQLEEFVEDGRSSKYFELNI